VSVSSAITFIITSISLIELEFEASERKENYTEHLLYKVIYCISQNVLNLFVYFLSYWLWSSILFDIKDCEHIQFLLYTESET